MIIYNVTCNVETDIAEDWLHWMKTIHIPEVMQTGLFIEFKIARILNNQSGDIGVNYAIQYHANTLDDYETYREKHAPELQKKTFERYGEKMTAFRTLLEVID